MGCNGKLLIPAECVSPAPLARAAAQVRDASPALGVTGWGPRLGAGLKGGAELREARLRRGQWTGKSDPDREGQTPLAAGVAEPSRPPERPAEGARSLPSLSESGSEKARCQGLLLPRWKTEMVLLH